MANPHAGGWGDLNMTVCRKRIHESMVCVTIKRSDLREALASIGVDIPDQGRIEISRFGTPTLCQFATETDDDTLGLTYVDHAANGTGDETQEYPERDAAEPVE